MFGRPSLVARCSRRGGSQLLCRDLLQHLEGNRERTSFRFAEQQVDVLGHDHIAGDEQTIPNPDPLQRLLEHALGLRTCQQRLTTIATKSDEM
jgi:hypothetical protein